jgi:small GTP-binding protein
MPSTRIRSSLLIYLSVGLLGAGYFLVSWMPTILERYQRTAEKFPRLGMLYLGTVIGGGLILLGLSVWMTYRLWRNTSRKRMSKARRMSNPSELSSQQQQDELAANLASGHQHATDSNVPAKLRAQIEQSLVALESKEKQQRLEIVAFGTISSGKSTLLSALAGRKLLVSHVVGGTTTDRHEIDWPGMDQVLLVDTPGLAEVGGQERAAKAAAAAKHADLVLLVVDGPLKSYEVALANQLSKMEKRIVVCLNKSDWYETEDAHLLIDQMGAQLPQLRREDLVLIRAASISQNQIRVLPNGTEQQQAVDLPPDIHQLAIRMMEIVQQDGRELLLANLLLQSRGLVDEAKARVRKVLDQRADEIIRRHMWAAGSATGLNPIPLLDIAGGSAVTVKMVLELARTYKQPLDADSAIQLLEGLGKNLIAMLGTMAATPAVAGALGTLLKTVPGIGTLTGGLLQGVVQALVTRWIGYTFVEYFQREMQAPPGGLAELAHAKWSELTTTDAIRQLVRMGRERIDQ